jgi:hypothetical protein
MHLTANMTPATYLLSSRVSGSTKTKTYGKGTRGREHEEQQTLPRRGLFGKDVHERSYIFKGLRNMLFPTETHFSGKLRYMTVTWRRRALP